MAGGQTRLLQSGYLRYYLMIVFVSTAGLAGATLIGRGRLVEPEDWSGLHFYDVGLVVLILLATVATVLAKSRLAAIAALGVVGYGVALVFVLFGAPDVAMTQFLVETLTVILFVLVFYHLRESPALSRPLARGRDALLAAAVGVLMTALVLVATDLQYHPPISSEFVKRSVREAHGRNLVNVILVDFRGLDTLGEITVLAAAGIGVYALLKLRVEKKASQAAAAEWRHTLGRTRGAASPSPSQSQGPSPGKEKAREFTDPACGDPLHVAPVAPLFDLPAATRPQRARRGIQWRGWSRPRPSCCTALPSACRRPSGRWGWTLAGSSARVCSRPSAAAAWLS
jgi:multisubunit Na+/H+ antiporter MnhB subunit